jgi:hypothetical protein
MKNFAQFTEESNINEASKNLLKKVADLLFDEDNDEMAEDYEKVEDFFSNMSEKEMEKFMDEVKVGRNVTAGDLLDLRICEWPAAMQNKAVEYLLNKKMIDEKGRWIKNTKESVEVTNEYFASEAKMIVMSHLANLKETAPDKDTVNVLNFLSKIIMDTKGNLNQIIDPDAMWKEFSESRFFRK